MKYKVVFCGGYTIWSAGDDAPMAFMTSELRKRFGNEIEFIVLCRHPNPEFDNYYGVKTLQGLEYENKSLSMEKWMRGLNFEDDRHELERIAEEISTADLLILGAGNFITEVSLDLLRGHLAQFAVLTLIADICNTPCMLFGLSANRLKSKWTARATEWMLKRATYVTFRDMNAIENLRLSGVNIPDHEILPDAALGAPVAPSNRDLEILANENIDLNNKEVLAVSLRDLSWMSMQAEYENNLIYVINRWTAREDRVILFIPQCTYHVDEPRTDDRFIAKSLIAKVEHPDKCFHISRQYQGPDIECLYKQADATLATRLHGSVFSAKMGTPVVGLCYEDKVKGFFRQLGQQNFALPINTEPDKIIEKIEILLSNKEKIKKEIEQKTKELKSEITRYVDIACELIAPER
jgi:polysaccharide pyruvyl transferase WcaK-like protein